MKEYRKAEFPFVRFPIVMLCGMYSAKEIAVYAALLKHADGNMECFPSRKTLAREAGMSVKTLDATLKKMKEKGLVSVERRHRANGNLSSNMYKLYDFLHVLEEVG